MRIAKIGMSGVLFMFALGPACDCGGTATETPDAKVQDASVTDLAVADTRVADTRRPDTFVDDAFRDDAMVDDASVDDAFVDDATGTDAFVDDAFVPMDAAGADGFVEDANTQADAAGADAFVEDAATSADANTTDALAEDAVVIGDGIAEARATEDGTGLSVQLTEVIITYIKPTVGSDDAGFFVQAQSTGPALFVQVDPGTLVPSISVGDTVSFVITEMSTIQGRKQAMAISDLFNHSSGAVVADLMQDVSAAADLLSALDSYESEYVMFAGTLSGEFSYSGSGHVAADAESAAITGDSNLKLRLPTTLRDALVTSDAFGVGCTFTTRTPLWRYNDAAQVSAWVIADIDVNSCPGPQVVSAVATSSSTVVVTFSQELLSTSINALGVQFTIPTLSVVTATLDGSDSTKVLLTTAAQDGSSTYTVTVADSITNMAGWPLDATANTADFVSFPTGLAISSVDYPVLAHGAQLVITGNQFTNTTAVNVGGVAQSYVVDSNTQITIAALSDDVATGDADIVVVTTGGSTPPFPIKVIHLVINELDSDTLDVGNNDAYEFVEVSTGVSAVSLQGYVLVAFNGNGDVSYYSIGLDLVTDLNGLVVLGNTSLDPAPDITFGNGTIQNGADAVAIYQGSAGDFANNTAVTTAGLIDAVVYDTDDNDDTGLLEGLLGTGDHVVQINENANAAKNTDSIQRCSPERLDGRAFQVHTASPRVANSCD